MSEPITREERERWATLYRGYEHYNVASSVPAIQRLLAALDAADALADSLDGLFAHALRADLGALAKVRTTLAAYRALVVPERSEAAK